ncbi:GNAT family N-acetyltransferase [Xenorhabdus nematophila]|uniref:GNAT family N-acetyltransferase n=1 Tax=Xenorhabdus nematophila TaxID=628 RepID=UPI001F32E549|nr:GNAT family N-acetyltransferase [Xenorhabdus nematophila]
MTNYQKKIAKKYPSALHCALIGRLAISKPFQRQGLGEILLIDAIRKAIASSKSIPTPMIIVDAKDDIAKKFYMNVGFQEFPQMKRRLFMPMVVAIEMLKKVDGV